MKNNSPLVSVCVIAYNHEKYLEETIIGIVNQKTTFDFELQIHDDASTDSTPEIIRKYEKLYPEIIKPTIQTENQLSQGIKPLTRFIYPKLKSKYVAFCEGDDYWNDMNKLQKQVDFMEAHPDYSLCAHDTNFIFEEGVKIKEQFYIKPAEGDFTFTFMDELKNHFIPTPSVLTRLQLILEMPTNFKSIVSGDIQLALYLLSRGKGYYFADKMSTKRRNRGGITFNKAYMSKAFEGAYELLFYISQFAPPESRLYIRRKMAEYERAFIKKRMKIRRFGFPMLIFRAIINNPSWFIYGWHNKPANGN